MRATHGILPKRVEVANKVINKLAITWSRTERFLGLSLSTWTFSAYAFTTLNFHTNDIVMLTLVGALTIGVNSAITMYELITIHLEKIYIYFNSIVHSYQT